MSGLMLLSDSREAERLDLLEEEGEEGLMDLGLPSFLEDSDYTKNDSFLANSTPLINQHGDFSLNLPSNFSQGMIDVVIIDSESGTDSGSTNEGAKFRNKKISKAKVSIGGRGDQSLDSKSGSPVASPAAVRNPFTPHVPGRKSFIKAGSVKVTPSSTVSSTTRISSLPSLPPTPIIHSPVSKRKLKTLSVPLERVMNESTQGSVELGRHASATNSPSINEFSNFLDHSPSKEYIGPRPSEASDISIPSFHEVSTSHSVMEKRVELKNTPRMPNKPGGDSTAATTSTASITSAATVANQIRLQEVNSGLFSVNRDLLNAFERKEKRSGSSRGSRGGSGSVHSSRTGDSTTDVEQTVDSDAEVASRLQIGRCNYSTRLQELSLELNPTLEGTSQVISDRERTLEKRLARMEQDAVKKDETIQELKAKLVESASNENQSTILEANFKVELELKDALATIATLEDNVEDLELEVVQVLRQEQALNTVHEELRQDLLARQEEILDLQGQLSQNVADFDATHAQLLLETDQIKGEEIEELESRCAANDGVIAQQVIDLNNLKAQMDHLTTTNQGVVSDLEESIRKIQSQEKELALRSSNIASLTGQLSKVKAHATKARSPLANEVFNTSQDLTKVQLESDLAAAQAEVDQLTVEFSNLKGVHERLIAGTAKKGNVRLNDTPRQLLDDSIFYKSVTSLKTPAAPGLSSSNTSTWTPLGDLSVDQSSSPVYARMQELETEITHLREELRLANIQIDKKLDSLQPGGSGTIKLAEDLRDARIRIRELENELRAMAKESDAVENVSAEIQEVNTEMMGEKEELLNQIDHLSQQVQDLEDALSESDLTIHQLESQFTALENTYNNLSSEYDALQSELPSLKTESKRLRKEAHQVGSEISILRETSGDNKMEIDLLYEELARVKGDVFQHEDLAQKTKSKVDAEVHGLGTIITLYQLQVRKEAGLRLALQWRNHFNSKRANRAEHKLAKFQAPKEKRPRKRNAAKWKAAVEQDNLLREVAYPAIRGKPFPKTATN